MSDVSYAPLVEPQEADFFETEPRKVPMPPGEARLYGNVYVYRWRSGRMFSVHVEGQNTREFRAWIDVWALACTQLQGVL